MARHEYTPEQRAEAVALYAEVGPSEVERRLGIPKANLTRWAQEAGVETVPNKKTEAATQAASRMWADRRVTMTPDIGAAAELALERTHEALLEDRPKLAKDYATTMAILIDKAQLLTGGATTRTDGVVGSRQLAEQLIDEVAKQREKRSAA